ncbi:MAG: hypothetical protein F6J87_15295 [Spirulina sp. SIO3F2]|nr:hypothetical protein [Spirulina sp. SIO3F2]
MRTAISAALLPDLWMGRRYCTRFCIPLKVRSRAQNESFGPKYQQLCLDSVTS